VGNQRLVVPVAGQFIIDFNLIQLDAVHREQAKHGAAICFKKVALISPFHSHEKKKEFLTNFLCTTLA
jgi:hypothetical protein